MKLFRKKKSEEDDSEFTIVDLYDQQVDTEEAIYTDKVLEHLQRIHEPDGYQREKQEHDFIDLGMPRSYLDALDEIEFTIENQFGTALLQPRKRGQGQVVSRWTVRGIHRRELMGVPPSGELVEIGGLSYTTFRDYRLRTEYTFWALPELTRRVVER
jgi:hypothetical protein